jgi:hypothetical protein
VLHVKDIVAASRFYQSLGFTQTAAYQRADGELTVAFLSFGPCTILLVPDLKRVYTAVRAAKLEILLEPVDEFYGDRVFMFLDADGYEWRFADRR